MNTDSGVHTASCASVHGARKATQIYKRFH